ncbi:MAG: hypothetical protein PHW63_10840 [Alphaproteobacteria bacterium]|nr:hypothetical protein [Alphaproteobacteria bacterium]
MVLMGLLSRGLDRPMRCYQSLKTEAARQALQLKGLQAMGLWRAPTLKLVVEQANIRPTSLWFARREHYAKQSKNPTITPTKVAGASAGAKVAGGGSFFGRAIAALGRYREACATRPVFVAPLAGYPAPKKPEPE